MKNILNFFTEKNENYDKAKSSLSEIKKRFDGFVISFPDVTPNEIMLIKEKWEVLPKSISKGVKIMALNFIDNYKTLLTNYDANSYIMPHKHDNEYEYGYIVKGELIDKFTGQKYIVGDRYKYNPNETHYLSSTNKGCLVYSTLTTDGNYELLPISKDVKRVMSEIDLT